MSLHYCLLQFVFWFMYGDTINYASVYLLHCNLSNFMIGILVAVGSVLTVLLQPSISAYADKDKSISLKWIIFILTGIQAVVALILFVTPKRPVPLTFIIYVVAVLLMQMLIPFINALGTESSRQGITINFGIARGVGSLGYAAMSYSMGILFAHFNPQLHPLTVLIAALLLMLLLFLYPFKKVNRGADKNKKKTESANPLVFLKHYKSFALALAGWVLIYISHVFINNYTYQIVVSKGGTSAHQGTAMAIASVVELPIMFLFTAMLKKAKSVTWFKISGVFFTLKTLGTLLAGSMPVFYAVQLFQMFGWGLISVASVYYVDSIMEEQDRIKGQAYMTMSYTIASIIGSLSGGSLIDLLGVPAMLITGSVSAALGTLVVFRATKGK